MSARAHRASGYRVRPRSARRPSRINWDRAGRILLVIVFFVIVLSYWRPVSNLFDARRELSAEQARLDELRTERDELARRAETLSAPGAAERRARELGMVAEGERSYVIDTMPW